MRRENGYIRRDFGKNKKIMRFNTVRACKKMTELGFSTSSNMVSKWEINYAVPNVLQFFGLCKIMNIYDINSACEASHD